MRNAAAIEAIPGQESAFPSSYQGRNRGRQEAFDTFAQC